MESSIANELSEKGIETIIVASVDMQGRLFGRRLPIRSFGEDPNQRLSVSTCALGWDYAQDVGMNARFTGPHTGWHDAALQPDLTAVYPLPWLRNTALVFADLLDASSNEEIPFAPRSILRRQQQRASQAGYTVKISTELEFYLFRCSYGDAAASSYAKLPPTTPQRSQDIIDHTTNAVEPFFIELRRSLEGAGIDVLYSEAEWGRGQWEVNVGHAEALKCSEAHLILKLAIKDIASKHGLAATFMSRPTVDDVGSSCHVNCSIWSSEGLNLFFDGAMVPPHGRHLMYAIGGLLARISDLTLWYAPTLNAYKRINGKQFAGCGSTWGIDNRTVTCRVTGNAEQSLRVEFRLPGADANPCLALAGVLGAMLDGIKRKLDPGPPIPGNAYDSVSTNDVPRSLERAAELFELSTFVSETFGADVANHYATLARYESYQSQQAVTDWELRRYFESA
jgi:glutamine synthetase